MNNPAKAEDPKIPVKKGQEPQGKKQIKLVWLRTIRYQFNQFVLAAIRMVLPT
jgi:hypothetical protein